MQSVHCTIHRLQLVIQDGLFKQYPVKKLLTKCCRMVTLFHHSPKRTKQFKDLQLGVAEGDRKVLCQDVRTRWNSTYLMLNRLYEMREIVTYFLGTYPEVKITFSLNEYMLIDSLCKILKKFFDVTVLFSADATSIAHVIPQMLCLKRFLEMATSGGASGSVKVLSKHLLTALKSRFFNPDRQCLLTADPEYQLAVAPPPNLDLHPEALELDEGDVDVEEEAQFEFVDDKFVDVVTDPRYTVPTQLHPDLRFVIPMQFREAAKRVLITEVLSVELPSLDADDADVPDVELEDSSQSQGHCVIDQA